MKRIYKLGIGVFLLAGVSLLLYPFVSRWLSQTQQSGIIRNYQVSIAEMNRRELDTQWQKAFDYNEALLGPLAANADFSNLNTKGSAEYESVLNAALEIGYVEIPVIDTRLPIYHGASDVILKKGVGHMANTAYPLGTQGAHSVLTGHSGLPSSMLFTKLDQVIKEDYFYIYILDEKLTYRVDSIEIILPSDTALLQPVPEKSYVTLLTCTPYGINSHRLLVRGEFVSRERIGDAAPQASAALKLIGIRNAAALLLIAVAVCTHLLILLFFYIRKGRTFTQ